MAQLGEKVWFRKIGEDCVSSCASRTDQGFFVGHRTGAALFITNKRGVRGKKLYDTSTERCRGCCEFGRLVWHSVANGGF